jgi:hypothetical protein
LIARLAAEEGEKDRLDDVLRIEARPDGSVQASPGQGRQAAGEAVNDLGGSIPLPGLQARSQVGEGNYARHANLSSATPGKSVDGRIITGRDCGCKQNRKNR